MFFLLQILIAEKANLNVQDNMGQSALHFACKNGHMDTVKLLLKHNVDLNPTALKSIAIKGVYVTPLNLAILHDQSDIAKLLLAKGALPMEKIIRIAATRIQAIFRSYQIRKSFQEYRELLLRHERLRKAKKGSKGAGLKNGGQTKSIESNAAGSFLGHVIEETHRTAAVSKD
jgi:hypothetical protein